MKIDTVNKESKKIKIKSGKNTLSASLLSSGPGPVIIICHGFTSCKEENSKWAEYLHKKGFNVITFDFSSHGMSSGKFSKFTITSCLNDALSVIEYIEKNFPENEIGIAGHSMGGTAALYCASKNKVSACVTLATPAKYDDVIKNMIKTGWIINSLKDWKSGKGKLRSFGKMMTIQFGFYKDAISIDIGKIAKNVKCPTLVVHGTKDTVVPFSHSEILYSKLSNAQIKSVVGGHSINSADTVHKETALWFKKWL